MEKSNGTSDSVLLHRSIPRLVEDQSVTRPDTVAVFAGPLVITYKELVDRATMLAGYLQESGVLTDTVVALCMKSSIAMVVGALGVFKAGAAYLPLDPSFPEKRLSYTLGDAQTTMVITTRDEARNIPEGPWKIVELDERGVLLNSRGATPKAANIKENDLAYVIYTSGSTGQPKGVEVTHGNLRNLLSWHQAAFSTTAADRATLIAGVAFDAAVWELWPYLTVGASLHVPSEAVRTDPEAMRNWLVDQKITISFLPTAMAERVMRLEWPPDTALRTLLTGADTLHQYPTCALPFVLVNNYGPTECTVVATSGVVSCVEKFTELPSIGRPITNSRVYILDEQQNPAPAGEPGELYVAGRNVARGYRNHPELSAAKFLHDPFVDGDRMYRTGDLGRYTSDGQIAFLGRIDDQIKLRGYRIEPNEVVGVLNQHPGISESALVAQTFSGDEKRLVAYVVPESTSVLESDGILEFLRTRLPDYMTPSAFVLLDQLPLTHSGKLDRAALPEPSPGNTLGSKSCVGPQSPVEERMALLLAELLDVDRIAMNDNFFHLGGHSLLGAQLIARIRDVFGVEVSLRTLFDNPTVEGISAQIEELILEMLEEFSPIEGQGILASEGRPAA